MIWRPSSELKILRDFHPRIEAVGLDGKPFALQEARMAAACRDEGSVLHMLHWAKLYEGEFGASGLAHVLVQPVHVPSALLRLAECLPPSRQDSLCLWLDSEAALPAGWRAFAWSPLTGLAVFGPPSDAGWEAMLESLS